MSTSVILGIWNSNQIQRIKIDNVDLQSKVQEFKDKAEKIVTKDWTNLDLAYAGIILENDNTLSSYGIMSGVTIHVLEKPKSKELIHKKKISDTELVNAFRTLTLLAGYRNGLQRLTRKDMIDKLIAKTPGLNDDPGALAIIQDPELIVHLLDLDTAGKIAVEYPILLYTAANMVALLQEEQANPNLNAPSTSTGYSYSLDALSDDDDDMDSNSDSNISHNPLTRNSSFNAITSAQLAAAIANATNTQFNTNSAGMPTTPTSSNIITNEMFSNAMQQAFAFGGNNGTFSPSTPTRNDDESIENLTRKWQTQLQQMHEMGLVNDAVNIRALKATSGDVNAAIELVLSLVSDTD